MSGDWPGVRVIATVGVAPAKAVIGYRHRGERDYKLCGVWLGSPEEALAYGRRVVERYERAVAEFFAET